MSEEEMFTSGVFDDIVQKTVLDAVGCIHRSAALLDTSPVQGRTMLLVEVGAALIGYGFANIDISPLDAETRKNVEFVVVPSLIQKNRDAVANVRAEQAEQAKRMQEKG